MANAAERVYSLIEQTVNESGVTLWDVRFLKEGASRYLRVFIDRDDGISVDDCAYISHLIDPIIDSADPIDESYFLEVCSCGLERELTRDRHFDWSLGKAVRLKLYKALDGKKEFAGILKGAGDEVVIETEDGPLTLARTAISKICLDDFTN